MIVSAYESTSNTGTYFIQIFDASICAARNLSFSLLNFSISKSSFANAFTTRFPLTFSCTNALSEEKQSRLRLNAGRTSFV